MKILCRALLFAILAIPALASAATWQIDPEHAFVEFKVKHLMVSSVKGVFTGVAGTIDADDADLAKATVKVTIDSASLDTNNAKRDEHLRSPDFLDVARFPTITFVSKRVVTENSTIRQVIGDLTIRGTTREVALAVSEFTPALKDPWGNLRRGATASTTINRQDFGLTWNKALEAGGVVVGDEVKITIDVELIRK